MSDKIDKTYAFNNEQFECDGRQPCSQSGAIYLFMTDIYKIQFKAGGCENGRNLYPKSFECATRGDNVMCLDSRNQYRMLIMRKDV